MYGIESSKIMLITLLVTNMLARYELRHENLQRIEQVNQYTFKGA